MERRRSVRNNDIQSYHISMILNHPYPFQDIAPSLLSYIQHILNMPNDIKLFFHAGETNWYGSIDENLVRIIFYNMCVCACAFFYKLAKFKPLINVSIQIIFFIFILAVMLLFCCSRANLILISDRCNIDWKPTNRSWLRAT